MSRYPTVSALTPQWGKTELTARAIAALRRSDYPGEIEALVYDNASPGGPGPVADRDDVTLLRGDENIGFGPAVNRLAAEATGDYILILNNDTIVDPRCVRLLVAAMSDPARPGVVAPRYRDFDGTVLEMGGYLGPDGSGWQLFRGTRPPAALERMRYPAHYGSAACLLVDRALFAEYGGFDDLWAPAYYEDTDLCFALREKGRPTLVEPRAIVYHYEGATAGKDVSAGLKSYQLRNQSRFVARWSDQLEKLPRASLGAALGAALAPPKRGHRILWAVPHLPRPDREAGHARIMRMIEALQHAGHRVSLWAEHTHDAGRYGRLLEDHGVAWFGGGLPSRRQLPAGQPRAFASLDQVLGLLHWDAVIISFAELADRLLPSIRQQQPRAAVLVDNVDLHFLRQERGGALGIADLEQLTKEQELATYRAADGVITASTLETEILFQELPATPAHTFAVAAEEPRLVEDPPPDGSLLFLGNFAHHPNVDAVDWWAGEIAAEVERLAERPIAMRVVGSGSESYRDVWPPHHLDIVGWVEDLADEFDKARVFIAPLRYGAGTKGKISAALARGLPTITTSIGAEGVTPEVLAALAVADRPVDIARHVIELMTDDEAWQERRVASAAAAEAEWRRQKALVDEFADWVGRRIRFRL